MGRPRKTIPIPAMVNRGAFNPEKFGVAKDPTKDFRWVSEERIIERQHNDGYQLVTSEHSPSADRTIRTKDKMALMVRSQDKADESAKNKIIETLRRESASKEHFDEQLERLSRKHNMNLRKYAKNEEGDD